MTSKRKPTHNSIPTALPRTPLTVGLDIGYGVVKVATNESVFAFPSVMGHAREIKFQQESIQQKYPGD